MVWKRWRATARRPDAWRASYVHSNSFRTSLRIWSSANRRKAWQSPLPDQPLVPQRSSLINNVARSHRAGAQVEPHAARMDELLQPRYRPESWNVFDWLLDAGANLAGAVNGSGWRHRPAAGAVMRSGLRPDFDIESVESSRRYVSLSLGRR